MSERYDCTDDDERERGLEAAVNAIRAGELVVVPTDTVYGLAADAFEPAAVARLLEAKGRGRDVPPPVLIGAPTTLDALTTQLPGYAREMVEALWPGALTVVARQQHSLTWDLGENRDTVAVRMPDDRHALALLKRTGPLAVSSANTHGAPAAVEIDDAQEMLGDAVAVYLDAGPREHDVPSTIVDVTGPDPRVLRQGAIPADRLREINKHLRDD